MNTNQLTHHRKLSEIARDIKSSWRIIPQKAMLYVDAMSSLNTLSDEHGNGIGNGLTVVCYFLQNAGSWRGEKARAIKLELKLLLRTY